MRGQGLYSPQKRPSSRPLADPKAEGGKKDEPKVEQPKLSNYWIGVILVVAVVLLWVGSSFLTKTIMKSFRKPWFLSYLCMISFQVYYIFLVVKDPVYAHHEASEETAKEEIISKTATVQDEGEAPVVFVGQEPAGKKPRLTLHELGKYAGIIFVFYTGALYLSSLSFQHTSVSSSTIMATTNGIFLFFFGLASKTDSMSMVKWMSVGLSSAGALTLVLFEGWMGQWRLAGNLMSFGSSALYGIYTVILQWLTQGDTSRISFPLLLAMSGTLSMIFLWPVFIILHYTGVETFVWPYDLASWASILFNVIFGSLVPTYLWTAAYELTTPLVVAIGISCAVPLTLLFDVIYSREVQWQSFVAGSLVVAGFLMINSRQLCGEEVKSDCCS